MNNIGMLDTKRILITLFFVMNLINVHVKIVTMYIRKYLV
jgi:hypothetical protein